MWSRIPVIYLKLLCSQGNITQARTTSQKEFTTYFRALLMTQELWFILYSHVALVSLFVPLRSCLLLAFKKNLRFTRTTPIASSESGTRFTGTWKHTCTFRLELMVLLNFHHSLRLRAVLCQVFFQIISWCGLKVIVGQDTGEIHSLYGILT